MFKLKDVRGTEFTIGSRIAYAVSAKAGSGLRVGRVKEISVAVPRWTGEQPRVRVKIDLELGAFGTCSYQKTRYLRGQSEKFNEVYALNELPAAAPSAV